jgi:hypothetical protein
MGRSRRQLLQHGCALGAAALLGGCDPYNTKEHEREAERKRKANWDAMTPQEQALARKFAVLGGGGELFVDSFGEKFGVNIFDERGHLFYASGTLRQPGNSKHAYLSGFGAPVTLRVEWRNAYQTVPDPSVPKPDGYPDAAYYGGTILGNYTVPVASRIPDELLDELRKNGGVFRLKIRIHDDGPLIGWDIQRDSQYLNTGGDFKENRLIWVKKGIGYEQVWEKGWYIHPKTHERIETDF